MSVKLIVVNKRNEGLAVDNLARFLTDRVPKAQRSALVAGGAVMFQEIGANLSIPPIGGSAGSHREALAAADHPYASRHSGIQLPSGRRGGGTIDPKLQVHTVTGQLLRALRARLDAGGGLAGDASFNVSVDPAKAPHARYVFEGSRVMHRRDTLEATIEDPGARRKIRKALVNEFRRALGFS